MLYWSSSRGNRSHLLPAAKRLKIDPQLLLYNELVVELVAAYSKLVECWSAVELLCWLVVVWVLAAKYSLSAT